MTVSMEVKLPETDENVEFMVNHPNAMPTVQRLSISQENTHEEWTITIDNPDSGTYVLNFVTNTSPPKLWKSAAIRADEAPHKVRNAI